MKDVKIGNLIVITGASGAGKDDVMNGVMGSTKIKNLGFSKIVTSTDRPPRPGETDGCEYHFVTTEKMQEMAKNGDLVEPITKTGTSNKATTKKEVERVFCNEKLIWRIDPSRASDIATGDFFKKIFPENADSLQKHTLVLFITAPKKDIEKRRIGRDKKNYNPKEYIVRDEQEKPYLKILFQFATPLENTQGKLNETIKQAINIIAEFNDKLKNQ